MENRLTANKQHEGIGGDDKIFFIFMWWKLHGSIFVLKFITVHQKEVNFIVCNFFLEKYLDYCLLNSYSLWKGFRKKKD